MSTEFQLRLTDLVSGQQAGEKVRLVVYADEEDFSFCADGEGPGLEAWEAAFRMTIEQARDLRDFLNLIVDRAP